MSEYAVLCPVPPGLADHVLQLLNDAEITGQKAVPRQPSSDTSADNPAMYVVVPVEDLDRAKSVIGLVLPQLLDPQEPGSGLSARLVRADEPTVNPLPVWRGPAGSLLDEPADELHDEEGNFVPPAPPPVPRPKDGIARAAWAAVILGPLLTIAAIVLNLDGLFIILGIGFFFVGFGTLIARAPERRVHDDPDQGAVV